METSQTIASWGDATFGQASLRALAIRAREELDKLIEAIEAGEDKGTIALEAADVTILLHRLCGKLGIELSESVNEKMVINRGRGLVKSGDGTGQLKPS